MIFYCTSHLINSSNPFYGCCVPFRTWWEHWNLSLSSWLNCLCVRVLCVCPAGWIGFLFTCLWNKATAEFQLVLNILNITQAHSFDWSAVTVNTHSCRFTVHVHHYRVFLGTEMFEFTLLTIGSFYCIWWNVFILIIIFGLYVRMWGCTKEKQNGLAFNYISYSELCRKVIWNVPY